MKEIFSEFSEVPEDLENPIEAPKDSEPVKDTKNDFSEDFYRFATRVFSDVILNQSADDKSDDVIINFLFSFGWFRLLWCWSSFLSTSSFWDSIPKALWDRHWSKFSLFKSSDDVIASKSLFLFVSLHCTSIRVMTSSSFTGNHPNPNVYFDATPSESILCLTVLQGIEKFIEEDLKEFKDRPELISVMQVVSRIKSFAVTAPLMKFIFGLELLLTKAQVLHLLIFMFPLSSSDLYISGLGNKLSEKILSIFSSHPNHWTCHQMEKSWIEKLEDSFRFNRDQIKISWYEMEVPHLQHDLWDLYIFISTRSRWSCQISTSIYWRIESSSISREAWRHQSGCRTFTACHWWRHHSIDQ